MLAPLEGRWGCYGTRKGSRLKAKFKAKSNPRTLALALAYTTGTRSIPTRNTPPSMREHLSDHQIDSSCVRAMPAKNRCSLCVLGSFQDSMTADLGRPSADKPAGKPTVGSLRPTIIQKRKTHGRDTGPDRHPPARHPARGPRGVAPWLRQKESSQCFASGPCSRDALHPSQNTKDELGPGPPHRGGASQHTQHREAIPRLAPGPRMYGHHRTTLTHTRTPTPEGPCVASSQTCNTKLSGSAGD